MNKAFLLNALNSNSIFFPRVIGALKNVLTEKQYNVDEYLLKKLTINHCTGCESCYYLTPGQCVIDDAGYYVPDKYINSDLTIFVTDIVFGGYSSDLKKAIDRIIPIVLPPHVLVDQEYRHEPRYSSYPDLLIIGCIPQQSQYEEKQFRKLAETHSKQFYSKDFQSFVFYETHTEQEIHYQLSVFI